MNTRPYNSHCRAEGFTLMELLVVIGVIALVAGLTVPSIANFMTAGSDSQAYNLLLAMASAGRADAVRTHNYTAVHVQCEVKNDLAGPPVGKSYIGLFKFDKGNGLFTAHTDFAPKALPGGMAFGEGSDYFLGAANTLQNLNNANMQNFTSFSIVFGPSGSLVRSVPPISGSSKIRFLPTDAYFVGATQLWYQEVANANGIGEDGARCVWIFKMQEFMAIGDNAAKRKDWLTTNGQQIPLNYHTGQLFPRE